MRTSNRIALATLCCAVALSACDRAPKAPLAPGNPSLSTADPTANSNGAVILRIPTASFLVVFDATHHLLSADMPPTVCTSGGLNIVSLQKVTTSSQVDQVLSQVTGDEQASVYHANSPADAGLSGPTDALGYYNVADFGQFCAFMASSNLIATGTVHRISTSSNGSWHVQWTGAFTGVDGQAYYLTQVYQLNGDVHDPYNPDLYTEPVVDIHLQPVGQ